MNNKTFSNNSIWIRQQYEISNKDGIDFIIIKKGAEKEVYEPLEQEILYSRPKNKLEHMTSTPHVALSRIDPENYEEILHFVNTWGFLGLKNTKKYTEETRLAGIFNNPYFHLEYQEIRRELYQDHMRKRGEKDREPMPVLQQAIRDYQQIILDLVKYRDYKLPDEFNSKRQKKDYVEELIKHEENGLLEQRSVSSKRNAIDSESGKSLVPFLKLNEMLEDVSPQIFWSVKESAPSRGWKFPSLLSAIYLRIHLDFGEGRGFTHCKWKNCRKLFIPRNPANQYCNERCRNSDNTYRHKLSIWLENIKAQFPNRSEQEIEKLFYSLVEDGYSGEKRILMEIRKRLD